MKITAQWLFFMSFVSSVGTLVSDVSAIKSHRLVRINNLQIRNGLIFEDQGTIQFLQQSIFITREIDYSGIVDSIAKMFHAIEILHLACREAASVKHVTTRDYAAYKGTQLLKCEPFIELWRTQTHYVRDRLIRTLRPFKLHLKSPIPAPIREKRALILGPAAFMVGSKIIGTIINEVRMRDLSEKISDNRYKIGRLDLGFATLQVQITELSRQTDRLEEKMVSFVLSTQELLRTTVQSQSELFGLVYDIVTTLNHFARIDSEFQQLRLDTLREVEILDEIVQTTKLGKPSHSVFPAETLNSVKAQVSRTIRLAESPSTYTTKVGNFSNFAFKVTTIIPAYGGDEYTLLKIFALPDLEAQKIPVIKQSIIAYKTEGMMYYPLTDLQVQVCQSKGCTAPTTQRTVSLAECGPAQTVSPDSYMCDWRDFTGDFYLRKTQHGMIFAFRRVVITEILCPDTSTEVFKLIHYGILSIPPGCKASVHLDTRTVVVAGPTKLVQLTHVKGDVTRDSVTKITTKIFTLDALMSFQGTASSRSLKWLTIAVSVILAVILGLLVSLAVYLRYFLKRGKRIHAKIRRIRHQADIVRKEGTRLSDDAFTSMVNHLTHTVITPAINARQEMVELLPMEERLAPVPLKRNYPALSENVYS